MCVLMSRRRGDGWLSCFRRWFKRAQRSHDLRRFRYLQWLGGR